MSVKRLAALLATALSIGTIWAAPAADAAVYVDDTPDPSWSVDGTVYATLIVDDTVYLGGQFQNAVSTAGTTLARRNLAAFSISTGEPVTGFRSDVSGGPVRALASDGTSLWVGGSFTTSGTTARARLAKVSASTGALDTAFAPVVDNTVRALELDGLDLYVGGLFTTVNGTSRGRVAQMTAATGVLDASFNPVANNAVYGLALDKTNRQLYVAGNFTSLGNAARTGMGAVNADAGALRPTVFASAARPTMALDLNPDGSRLFGAGGGGTNAAASWSTSTGVRQWRQTTNGDIQAIKYYGGSVFFGFHDGFQGDTSLKALAANAETGVLDPDFRPTFDQFWGAWSLDATDNGLVVGGDFTQVSGVPARGVAIFKRDGALPPPPPTVVQYVGATTPWRYWDQGTRPTNWQTSGFNDAAWPTGLTQLGYGDGDEDTVIGYGPSSTSRYITSYYRTTVQVSEAPDTVTMLMAADDGAVVYVNGVEAARDNMPTGTVGNTTRATTGRSGGPENELRSFNLQPSLFQVGSNTIAVELHQDTTSSTDASFDADVTATIVQDANNAPNADFTATVSNLDVAFDAVSSSDAEGPIASYEWNYGDGSSGTGGTASHHYAQPGNYTVTLRVKDSAGVADTAVQTVTTQSVNLETDVVANGAAWSWLYPTTDPGTTWRAPTFDASTWSVGNAVLGFGGTVATNINTFANTADRPVTAYFRRSFDVADATKAISLTLTTVANDGVIVYVNGVEVGRSNMPTGTIGWRTYATTARSAATANAAPVTITVPTSLLTTGTNVIAAETHLNYRGTADVGFDLKARLVSQR